MRALLNNTVNLLAAAPNDIFQETDMTSTITSRTIDLQAGLHFSVFLKWSGTPTGTFKLQASNDLAGTNPDAVVDWEDVTGSSYSVAGAAGQLVFNYDTAPFRWIRIVYTAASGSGTLTKALITLRGV